MTELNDLRTLSVSDRISLFAKSDFWDQPLTSQGKFRYSFKSLLYRELSKYKLLDKKENRSFNKAIARPDSLARPKNGASTKGRDARAFAVSVKPFEKDP